MQTTRLWTVHGQDMPLVHETVEKFLTSLRQLTQMVVLGIHSDTGHTILANLQLIMAALRSRCGHYIFALWFLSSIFFFFSSPNLSRRRWDVYHGVALVRI